MARNKVTLTYMIDFLVPWLDLVGCNPRNQNLFARVRWLIAFAYCVAFTSLITIHAVLEVAKGINITSIEALLNFFLLIQFAIKYIFYKYHANSLNELFRTMSTEFWSPDSLHELKDNTFEKSHYRIYLSMKLYRYGYVIMNACYGIEPIISNKRIMRLPIWVPWHEHMFVAPYYELLYCCELIMVVSADFVMAHFELMSMLLLGTAFVQLEMIKDRLRLVGHRDHSYAIVKSCAKHHIMILSYLDRFTSTFSLTMFQQVITYCMAIALPAFLFTTTRNVPVGFVICAIINAMNFFLYCLVGQYLQDQSKSISEAVYESGWWEVKDRRFKQAFLLIMQRSLRGATLTAAGVVDFTLDTFISTMKTTFSLLQILWSINDK